MSRGLQLARDVYGPNPKQPQARPSLPVVTARPVVTMARSEDLYVQADHWVGMSSRLTVCTCLCHARDGEEHECGEMRGRPAPNWCNASPRS